MAQRGVYRRPFPGRGSVVEYLAKDDEGQVVAIMHCAREDAPAAHDLLDSFLDARYPPASLQDEAC